MTRVLLWAAIAVVTTLLLLNITYCWHGSLEEFPTDEQQEKIRIVSTFLGAVLVLIDAILLVVVRRRSS